MKITLRYLEHQIDEMNPATEDVMDRAMLIALKTGLCMGLCLAAADAEARAGVREEALVATS